MRLSRAHLLGAVLSLVLSCVIGIPAQAQNDPLLIIPTRPDNQSSAWTDEATRIVHEELKYLGDPAWSPDEITNKYKTIVKQMSTELSKTELAQWASASRSGLSLLSRQEYDNAVHELRRALSTAEAKISAFNRDEKQAQEVLDTCLYLVRAFLEMGNEEFANKQVSQCRQLVPRTSPNVFRHTPEVQALYSKSEVKDDDPRATHVQVTHSSRICQIRFNGVVMGTTPFTTKAIVPGTYNVESDCTKREDLQLTRVFFKQGTQALDFDNTSDARLETSPTLHFVYPDQQAENLERHSDAVSIANYVHTWAVILLSVPEPNVLRLDIQPLTEKHVGASSWVRLVEGKPDRESLRDALSKMMDGKSYSYLSEPPKSRSAWMPPPRDKQKHGGNLVSELNKKNIKPEKKKVPKPALTRDQKIRRQRKAGIIVGASGVAMTGAGVALYFVRNKRGDEFIATLDPFDEWHNLRIPELALASAGSAALTTAAVLALPRKEKTPWWAWVSGAVGAGGLAYGIYKGVTAPAFPSGPCAFDATHAEACVKRGKAIDQSVLISLAAAPLISVPLVYIFRRDEPSSKKDKGKDTPKGAPKAPAKDKEKPKVGVGAQALGIFVYGEF